MGACGYPKQVSWGQNLGYVFPCANHFISMQEVVGLQQMSPLLTKHKREINQETSLLLSTEQSSELPVTSLQLTEFLPHRLARFGSHVLEQGSLTSGI